MSLLECRPMRFSPIPWSAPVAGFARALHFALALAVGLGVGLGASRPVAAEPAPGWQLASESGGKSDRVVLFVESKPTPGRPSFRLETRFPVPPPVVHRILVEGMLDPKAAPRGQTRKVLSRDASGALVHSFIELPLMMADREVALRVRHSHDPATGVYRVDWAEENEALPPPKDEVVRLAGASGYWEFRPDGRGGSQAVHVTRAEIGGSFPVALGDRLMKSQAVEAVDSLRARIERAASDVAAGPPAGQPAGQSTGAPR